MRLTRLLAAGLLAVGLSQFSVGKAEACIKFDRAAEMALIDEGIAAKTTSEPSKAVLRAIRRGHGTILAGWQEGVHRSRSARRSWRECKRCKRSTRRPHRR